MKDFAPLRDERDRRGKALQAAGNKMGPDEACKLFTSLSQAEEKMLKFVQVNAKSCGIPPEVTAQLKGEYVKAMQIVKRACDAAAQRSAGGGAPAGPSLSDVIGSAPLPDAPAKAKGGSTFDTINGNVLAR